MKKFYMKIVNFVEIYNFVVKLQMKKLELKFVDLGKSYNFHI
jgi:hypothetical protein